MRLLEVLTRTRFQIFTFEQGTLAKGAGPTGAGSGFMLKHKDWIIFVTADHVSHPKDYKPGLTRRVFEDKDVAIVNNWIEKDDKGNQYSILTSIGGFYYFDKFKFSPDNGLEDFKPFDSTFSFLGADRFTKPFKSEPLSVENGPDVPGGLDMVPVPSESVISPKEDDRYIVYGHTNIRYSEDKAHLEWNVTHHEDMKYKGENGDYYILTPNEPIIDSEWHGISGAPVFNQEGGILGVLCGGNPEDNYIFVMKIQKVLSLVETTLRVEKYEALRSTR